MRCRLLTLSMIATIAGACSSEVGGGARTGAMLTVLWDSALDPHALSAGGKRADGSDLAKLDVDAEMFVGPAGVRSQEIFLELAAITAEEQVMLRVEGLDAERRVIAIGETFAKIVPGTLVSASMRLFLPINPNPNPPPPPNPNPPPPPNPQPTGTPIYMVEHVDREETMSREFIDVPGGELTFTPESADEMWVVFISGVLASTDLAEISAEMRILVNDVEVDFFGHQTRGTAPNGAGFLTFEPISGTTEPQHVVPQFRTAVATATTSVSWLRVVAARMPANADVHVFEDDSMYEGAGHNVELGSLVFTPSRAGDYAVFAKATQREFPSSATSQTWLEDQEHNISPLDERGAKFSNGRDALQPVFTTMVSKIDSSNAKFTLRGTSSGVDDGLEWWNSMWPHRALLSDANGLGTFPADGASINFRLDHRTLVAEGRSLQDGSDVRVVANVAGVWTQLDRVLDPDSSWVDGETSLWFSTAAAQADPAATYYVYYGNLFAEDAPADPFSVFLFYDDFSASLDTAMWRTISGSPTVRDGALVVEPGLVLRAEDTYVYGWGALFEAKLRIDGLQTEEGNLDYFGAGSLAERILPIAFAIQEGTHVVRSANQVTPIQVVSPELDHRYAFSRKEGEVYYTVDGAPVGQLIPQLPDLGTPYPVAFSNAMQVTTAHVDWVRVMLSSSTEAVAGAEESLSGTLPSQWQYRKVIAFRLDAFSEHYQHESPGLSATNTPERLLINAIDVPAPAAEVWELSLQSIRVAGDSSDTARRSGVLLMNGDVLLSTGHKINKAGDGPTGYHHVAGVVRGGKTEIASRYENTIRSPEGITVEGADSAIIVLRY